MLYHGKNCRHQAHAISPYGLNLPSALSLNEEDVDLLCQALVEVLDAGAGSAL